MQPRRSSPIPALDLGLDRQPEGDPTRHHSLAILGLTAGVFELGDNTFVSIDIPSARIALTLAFASRKPLRWPLIEASIDGFIERLRAIEAETTRAVEAWSDERNLLQTVIESIPHRVFWKDRNSVYLGANRAFVRDAGIEHPRDIIGKTDYDMPWLQTEADFFRRCDAEVMQRGEALLDIEEPQRRADGQEGWLRTSKVPLRDLDGTVIGILGIYTDITTIKRTQADLERTATALEDRNIQLARARDRMASAIDARGRFIANLSHELRTPLHAILGLTHLLADTSLEGTARDYAETIGLSAEGLVQMIDDMLDLADADVGRLELRPEAVDVRALLHTIGKLLGPAAAAKGLELSIDLDARGETWALLDRARTRQILLNVVGNAVKFTESGRVDVEGTLTAERLVVRVQDTGIGIPDPNIDKIFDRFYQVHDDPTRTRGGPGLGLSLCRTLAELMNGTLVVSSQVGVGSTFTLSVPTRRCTASKPALPRRSPSSRPPRTVRILLAEDNPVNKLVATKLLEKHGCQVVSVDNGAKAVETALAPDADFDLVLMDMQMPIMDGLQATRIIRSTRSPDELPIVALSANAMASDRDACLASGMNDHLAKPIDHARLRALLLAVGSGDQVTAPR